MPNLDNCHSILYIKLGPFGSVKFSLQRCSIERRNEFVPESALLRDLAAGLEASLALSPQVEVIPVRSTVLRPD